MWSIKHTSSLVLLTSKPLHLLTKAHSAAGHRLAAPGPHCCPSGRRHSTTRHSQDTRMQQRRWDHTATMASTEGGDTRMMTLGQHRSCPSRTCYNFWLTQPPRGTTVLAHHAPAATNTATMGTATTSSLLHRGTPCRHTATTNTATIDLSNTMPNDHHVC